MKDFWNERYSQKKYVYGTSPNKYFEEKIKNLPIGKILLPAEGEGRNAVFASRLGWKVKAFDQSFQAKMKASELASMHKQTINFELSSFEEFDDTYNSYDCIALIYSHFDKNLRSKYHRKKS